MNERISKYAQVTLESCAYAGTGNVLKVQQLLALAGEHIELKEEESWKVSCQSSLQHTKQFGSTIRSRIEEVGQGVLLSCMLLQ